MTEQTIELKYIDTDIPGLPGMLVEGPLHRDDCGHAAGSYVGSFVVEPEENEGGQRELVDMYVFSVARVKDKEHLEVCLRTGEDGDYYSPGDLDRILNTEVRRMIPVYDIAAKLWEGTHWEGEGAERVRRENTVN